LRRGRDGDAFFPPVGATGQIADGLVDGGSGDNGARRRHAVHQPKNLKLGLELVRDAVDHEVGFADSVFDCGNERDRGQSLGTELLADRFPRVMQVAGHDVLKQDAIASAGRSQREPAAEGPSPDDGNGEHNLQRIERLT